MMHTRFVACLICLVVSALGWEFLPTNLYADGSKEFVTSHPMPAYRNSIPASDTDPSHRLSKDSLEQVREYYESCLLRGDRIQASGKDAETGFCIIYAEKVGNRELTAPELCASKRVVQDAAGIATVANMLAEAGAARQTVDHPAFNELAALVTKKMHTQTELDAAEKDYGMVATAYYRTVQDPDSGKSISEGDLIIKRATREAHPNQDQLKVASKTKVSAEDKAQAQDLKRQMQELKAKGDIAGMMQLAQGSPKFQQPPAGQQAAMTMAQDDMNRDTWSIWLKCLQDLKLAAYQTRIVFSQGVLAQ